MPAPPSRTAFRLFVPILAGATWRERIFAAAGATLAVALTALATGLVLPDGLSLPLLAAPVAASAVILFAIPTSPLAQPWPTIGGNMLSAAIGVAVASAVPEPIVACGLAVGLAMVAMSLARCFHPPGGAAALLPILGGPAVASAGFGIILLPVGLNAMIVTALGLAFHSAFGRPYPNRPARPAAGPVGSADVPAMARVGFGPADVDAALAALGETFDIDRADLDRLLRRVELIALQRRLGPRTAADIMSRHVIAVAPDTDPGAARRLLLERGVRVLPVVEPSGRLAGSVGLRELERTGPLPQVASPPVAVRPTAPVTDLVAPLTGPAHAVMVTDDDGRLLGLVTQTDLIAALVRQPAG